MTIPQSAFIDGMINLTLNSPIIKGRDSTFHVHYWGAIDDHRDNVVHQHSFFEMCYVLEGSGTYIESDCEYPLQKNALFLSRPLIKHQIINSNSLFLIFVGFEIIKNESSEIAVELFKHLEKSKHIYITDASELPSIQIWKSLLVQSWQQQQLFQDSILALSCALLTSFASVFNQLDETQGPPKKLKNKQGYNMSFYKAKLFISDNLAFPSLLLSDVASHLNISNGHLSRIFKSEYGASFKEYVRKERIRQASILLTTTNKTIKKISEETGFDTVHYFTTVFTEILGISPGRFKNKYHKSTTL